MTLDPAEAIYVLTVTWVRHHEHQTDHERLARWLAREYPLDVIEGAAEVAFDPPRGHVEMLPLAVLLHARRLARSAVPASGEVRCFDPRQTTQEVEAALLVDVEGAFESFVDP